MNQDLIGMVIKFTIAISVVAIFYKTVLEKLTFYKSIRWYFLASIVVSIIVSIVSISLNTKIEPNTHYEFSQIDNLIPSIHQYTKQVDLESTGNLTVKSFGIFLYILGFIILLIRFGVQIVSFTQIKKTAKRMPLSEGDIFISPQDITPFSFGNSIFVSNTHLDLPSLEKIVAHEMIHIKQYHSIDMVVAEVVCILNWFNPLAWILKKSIRQNLEYLADDIMLSRGTDIKAYQYLLLQTLGHSPYSLASGFNFHSLKSRIMMMNQNKSHYLHKLKFLLLVPLILLVLFAFRSIPAVQNVVDDINNITSPSDTTKPIKRDYNITISHDKDGKQEKATVKFINGKSEVYNLKDEKSKQDFFVNYDMPPPPPPPPAARFGKDLPIRTGESTHDYSLSFTPDDDDKIKRIQLKGNRKDGDYATVYLKDGSKERYNLNDQDAKDEFDKKYGDKIPDAPPMPPMPAMPPMAPMTTMPPMSPMSPMPAMPPMAPMTTMPPMSPMPAMPPMAPMTTMPPMSEIPPMPPMPPMAPLSPLFDFELPSGASLHFDSNKKITVTLENGSTESYNLKNETERDTFFKKYGKTQIKE